MSVNFVCGEVLIWVGGVDFFLCLIFVVLVVAEGELGLLFVLVECVVLGGFVLVEMVVLFWYCLCDLFEGLMCKVLGEVVVG